MAQEFLHTAEVCSSFEEVGGERMSEGVREGSDPPAYDSPDGPGVHASTAPADPQPVARVNGHQMRTAEGTPTLHRDHRRSPDRHGTVTASLSAYDHRRRASYRAHRHRGQLRNPNSGRVEDFEQRPIPEVQRIGPVDRLDGGLNLTRRQRVRQWLRSLGTCDTGSRVGGDEAPTNRVVQERPDRRSLPGGGGTGVTQGVELGEEPTDDTAIDQLQSGDALVVTEIQELAQVPAICLDRVRREAPLVCEPTQITIDRRKGPRRELGN